MLSHRSGCTALQPNISKKDFETIHKNINKKELFGELYEYDKNYKDNQYYLLKSKNELKYVGEHITEEEKIKIFDEKTEELLKSISEAVEILVNEKDFDSTKRDHYLSSSNPLSNEFILDFNFIFFKSQHWK